MSLPKPLCGLVINYSYLRANEAAKGYEDGRKNRPVTVVMSINVEGSNTSRVYVLPITHSPPINDDEALEIPAAVCISCGLDASPSWVVLSEFNEFIWPGTDLNIIPNKTPRTIAYGFMTAGFFNTIRDKWLALKNVKKTIAVLRDV